MGSKGGKVAKRYIVPDHCCWLRSFTRCINKGLIGLQLHAGWQGRWQIAGTAPGLRQIRQSTPARGHGWAGSLAQGMHISHAHLCTCDEAAYAHMPWTYVSLARMMCDAGTRAQTVMWTSMSV